MKGQRTPQSLEEREIRKSSLPENLSFALTLNKLLSDKKIHQRDFAKMTEISTGMISAYRRGEKSPTLPSIIRIAKALDVDCHYLLTGVKSANHKISEYTGLAEGAIDWLHKNKDAAPVLLDLLNALFSEKADETHYLADILLSSMYYYATSQFTNVVIEDFVDTERYGRMNSGSSKLVLKYIAQENFAKVLDVIWKQYSDFMSSKAEEARQQILKEQEDRHNG